MPSFSSRPSNGRGVPVQLRQLVGMGAERERGELAVGHDRQRVDLVDRLADPLVLVERGDAAGVVADHHVGLGFVDRHLDLAVDGEGAGELALADDVAEAEAAAVVPGRIVDDVGAQRLHQAGGDGDAVAVHDGVVIDHVLRHHLVDVAGRMDGRADLADVDDLALLDAVAHHVQPFRIVHDLFRDQQLAVDQAAELAEDLLDLRAQLGRLHQEDAHFLVVAEGCAAMHQRKEGAGRQALRLRRHIGLVEVAQEHGGEADHIADAGAVIVPGGAGGLVGLVEIAHAQLVHQPEHRRGIAGDVAALAAGLVLPQIGGGDFLVPAVERARHDRLVLLVDAVDDDLAVLFELPHGVAHVLDAVLVGQHRAAVDLGLDPGGGASALRPASGSTASIRCRGR